MRIRTLPITNQEGEYLERLIRTGSLKSEREVAGAIRSIIPRLADHEVDEVVEHYVQIGGI